MSRDFVIKKPVHETYTVLYPAKNKKLFYIFSYLSELFNVVLHHFYKKTSACGSQVGYMWVTSSQSAQWVSGSR